MQPHKTKAAGGQSSDFPNQTDQELRSSVVNSLPTEAEGTIVLDESYLDYAGTEARQAARHDMKLQLADMLTEFTGIHPQVLRAVLIAVCDDLDAQSDLWPMPDTDELVGLLGDAPGVQGPSYRERLADQITENDFAAEAFEGTCQMVLARDGVLTAELAEHIAREELDFQHFTPADDDTASDHGYTLTDKPITCESCGESQPLDNALDWHMTVQFTCPTCHANGGEL